MEKNNERAFRGVWIPKEIWESRNLSIMEKIFLVEIDSLDNEKGCWASNGYFAEFFDISKSRCSQIINSLIEKKLLSAEYERDGNEIKKRTLRVFKKLNRGYLKNLTPYLENLTPYLENAKENNTNNNTNNNTLNNNKAKKICFDETKLKNCIDVWIHCSLPKLDYETAVLMLTEQAVEHMEEFDMTVCIRNYSDILKSPDHHYTYKWMFWTFLDKGFKKFLPQCNPHEAFKDIKKKGSGETEEDKLKRIREAMV